jgi:hypothetical protein
LCTIAYNCAHYFPYLIDQMKRLFDMAIDSFGVGLTGLLRPSRRPALPMGVIWHPQVVVVLCGHIAGVWLAHKTAIRDSP